MPRCQNLLRNREDWYDPVTNQQNFFEARKTEMRDAWGKFDEQTATFHPLAHHCMDVAAVFARLARQPIVAARLSEAAGQPINDSQIDRLTVLVFLHDVGKLHPGFQAKGWPKELWRAPRRGHLVEGWSFLCLAAQEPTHPFHEAMQRIMEWGSDRAISELISAVFTHHGRPVACPLDPTIGEWDSPSTPEFDWRAEAGSLQNVMMQWFGGAFENQTAPLPDAARFHHELAGLVVLADWIGSDESKFKFHSPLDVNYRRTAQLRAKCAVEVFHPKANLIMGNPAPDFTKLTGFAHPNPAQVKIGEVDLDAKLVILEAETGSGKTEAALWRFTQLLAAGKVSGLYFAVPTRSAARQLHRRVDEAMQRAFGKAAPEAVLAVPGTLRTGGSEGQRLPGWKVRWDDERDDVPDRWAAEQATRFLAATVAVGTVDQAMLASLQVKHAHMRGTALSHSLLVVDEVHASDTYMTEVLARLLKDHSAVGGYAMLMSATLGARARMHWTGDVVPSFVDACASPYPAVWIGGLTSPRRVKGSHRSKTINVHPVSTMDSDAAAQRAIDYAEKGARVLVIRNMVSTAVDTWRSVLNRGAENLLMQVNGGPALHHGRFAAEDRFLLDKAVELMFGPNKNREPLGCIAIGTQTLEQSLDIDADVLISDLCPIDVLLQRIGRLHRHDSLPRSPRFEMARCDVLMPEAGLDWLAERNFENGLGAWESQSGIHGIYLDLAGLELTRRLIQTHPEWTIPEMNRTLVEGVTHPECIDAVIQEMGETWREYERKVGGAALAQKMVAGLNILDRATRFEDMRFPDSDVRVMTRLGEEGIVYNFDGPTVGPFGSGISRIALPARFCHGLRGDEAVIVKPNGARLWLSIGETKFTYSREGLELQS